MPDYPVDWLVFVDESACSERTLLRKYGYSPRSTPAIDVQWLRRIERWSLLPAYDSNGYLEDPLIVKAAVDGEIFKEWLQECVLLKMNPFPGPRSILIMDNRSTHRITVGLLS
ncbi:hypothetical protein P152DRAFT_390625 [Eremomyces bilateralis CBS 781.70]|uniref:Tc1-like transposase DDE domain-containing protein n=1 Tax=Eremomyces bilateralis CBS 781.70 TaxID=1392243 RepID=A0A6G1GC29_9PEZI|nr:uncharacterized protein P152DRAFT_390625 [Eremomyces bilateralis CBS 781.70]KAF1815542.1 hypothetical protein P152DRAFT_390625 [Eremomyces bilateralis CBS 781.70]